MESYIRSDNCCYWLIAGKNDACISIGSALFAIERTGNEAAKQMIPRLRSKVSAKKGPIHRIRLWRNNATAHISILGMQSHFYEANPMNITIVDSALSEIDLIINELSLAQNGTARSAGTLNRDLIQDTKAMFWALAIDAKIHQNPIL